MFNSTVPYSVPVAPIYGNGGGFGNGFGGDGLIGLIIILALLGWGGNGFGFGGFGGGAGLQGMATRADINEGFALQNITSGIQGIQQGICDGVYALNNSINNGFHGVDNAICNLGYNVQSGFNGLSSQLAQCCCDNRAAIADVKYQMATQACDTRHAIQDSTRQILDFLTTDKIASLQAENQSLKFKASQAEQNAFITANQNAQTAELIRRLGADCPTPAYLVPNPNCCYNAQVSFGNGCGCGSY